MTNITENSIERLAIERPKKLGYEYIYAPNMASNGASWKRGSLEQIILTLSRIKAAQIEIQN